MEKRTMKRILVLVVGLAVSGPTWSESWIGLNYAALEQDNRFYRQVDERLDTTEGFLRFGADMNDTFGSELRVGASTSATEEQGYTFEHNYIAGGFLRAQYELGFVSPYLITGLIYAEEEATTPTGRRRSESFDDIAIGAGLDFSIGSSFGVNAEYMRYYKIGPVSLRGPSAGVYWRF
jgi:opacity protein-like surface antigen